MIVGIDPGAKGAMAIIHENEELEIIRFSKCSLFDGLEVDKIFRRDYSNSVIYMEKVHSMPWDTPVTAFSFGKNVGLIEATLRSGEGVINYVTPQTWQKELHLERIDIGKSKTPRAIKEARKRSYVVYAQKMFPKYKDIISLETADAVLIAQYGYNRTYEV